MNWRAALRPLYLAFYSAPFYREVGRELSGSWFGYLFFLVTLCAIPGMVGGYGVISDFFGRELPAVIRQVPAIAVSGGRATIEPPGPHVVRSPVDNSPLLILDTSGQVTSLDNTKAAMLLTRDRMLLRQDSGEPRVFPMSGLDNGVYDQDWFEAVRTTIWNWMTVIYFPMAALISFLFRVLQVLLVAVIGLLYARRLRVPIDYSGALRLTVFAATPAVVASALRDALRINSNLGTVLDFLLVLGYVHFAIRANAVPLASGELSIKA